MLCPRACASLKKSLLLSSHLTKSQRYLSNKSDDGDEVKAPSDKKDNNELAELKEQKQIDVRELKKSLVRKSALGEENDFKELLINTWKNTITLKPSGRIPQHCDILIIGGGIVCSCVAYFIKKIHSQMSVTVIERDSEYTSSSTFWSLGGVRQQFSLPENIKMSMFSYNFIRKATEILKADNARVTEPVDVPFHHDGYLFLASKEKADIMSENHRTQLSLGAKVILYDKEELKKNFKWLNTDGIELGSYGFGNEGWVDARKLLVAVRAKATALGVHYGKGELIGFEAGGLNNSPFKRLKNGLIDTFDGNSLPVSFSSVVNAAGPWAGRVADFAGIGAEVDVEDPLGPEIALMAGLPVEARKRFIYMIHAPDGPMLNVPLTIDSSGVFLRRYNLSNMYLCGLNQSEELEEKDLDLNKINYEYFYKYIKPRLVERVPSFKNMKLVNAWAGYYDYNTFDQNLIVGPHPVHRNFFFANGSSGHGLQHAPAIGLAVAEHIIFGNYRTIDLTRFGFERVINNRPLKEIDVV